MLYLPNDLQLYFLSLMGGFIKQIALRKLRNGVDPVVKTMALTDYGYLSLFRVLVANCYG